MKGYVTGTGYMGLIGDRYILFSSEDDYTEYVLELQDDPAEAL